MKNKSVKKRERETHDGEIRETPLGRTRQRASEGGRESEQERIKGGAVT